MFSTDPLEKAFSKLRQGSGGTYFINAQQVTEKLRIQKAKFQITLDHSMVDSSVVRSHQCENCNYDLKSDESNLFDELSSLEAFVNRETKINLVHIAGYVSRKNPSEVDEDTYRRFNAIVSQLKMHYFSGGAFESLISSQLLKKEKYI